MSRTSPPRPPAAPPADAAEGAARVHELLLKLFDRKDGTGADWRMMLESLYRAGFQMADKWPEKDAARALMLRVHEGSYRRMTDDQTVGAGASKTEPAGSVPAPSNTAVFKSAAPRPPKVGQ